jgi:hypothetical protein
MRRIRSRSGIEGGEALVVLLAVCLGGFALMAPVAARAAGEAAFESVQEALARGDHAAAAARFHEAALGGHAEAA